MNSKKGYSLIEIIIGIAIIIIFMIGTHSLINASYDRYRLILQRNEAIDFAIREMETVLQSEEVYVSDIGHIAYYMQSGEQEIQNRNSGYMTSRVKIEKVKENNDKVFLVTVNVEFSTALNDDKKHNIKLQSLKVVE